VIGPNEKRPSAAQEANCIRSKSGQAAFGNWQLSTGGTEPSAKRQLRTGSS